MKVTLAIAFSLAFISCASMSLPNRGAAFKALMRTFEPTVCERYDLVCLTSFLRATAAQMKAPDGGVLPTQEEGARWGFRPDSPMMVGYPWTFTTLDPASDQFVLYTIVERASKLYGLMLDCERLSRTEFRVVGSRMAETDNVIPGRGFVVISAKPPRKP